MSKVELISLTPDAEKTMAYIARVSNPSNQKNEDYSKLLSYCIKNEHWSVFEQSFMTLQIETNRGIAAQILRHRSFTFQEFSQRYADSSQLGHIPLPELRRQDFKNRQNSIPDLPEELKKRFKSSLNLELSHHMEQIQIRQPKMPAAQSFIQILETFLATLFISYSRAFAFIKNSLFI